MKDIVLNFRNVAEFEAYLNNGKVQPVFESRMDSTTQGKDFTGTESYEEADNLLKYGDRESYDKIKQSRRKIESTGKGRRNELFTAICGVTPNVPAYLAGSPAAMINTRKKPVKNKVLKIYYNCAVHCRRNTEEIAEAAAAVLQTVCDVESSGTRVQLYAVWFSVEKLMTRGQKVGCCVCLKKAEEKLDPLKIAYPTVNPSFIRRHCFRFLEMTKGVAAGFNKCYGYPINKIDETREVIGDKKAVYLSCESIIQWSETYQDDPAKFIAEEIHDQLNK